MLKFVTILTILILTIKSQLIQNQQINVRLQEITNFQYSTQLRIQGQSLVEGEKKHLFIEVQGLDLQQYFDIRINVTKEGMGSIGFCQGVRHLCCVIDGSLLVKGEDIVIRVESVAAGDYGLVAYRDHFQELKEGYLDIKYEKFISKNFVIKFDPEFELPESIRILLRPEKQNLYSHIYVKTSTNQVETFDSINMWEGVQGLFLKKTDYSEHRVAYLTIIGQLASKYTINYEILHKDHHDLQIPQNVDEFIPRNSFKDYHLKIEKPLEKEEIIANFQIFSGNPSIIFYTDPDMKNSLKSKYFQYMTDSRFVFSEEQLKDGKNLYCKVRSSDHDSIFRLDIQQKKKEQAQYLTQNAYNFHSVVGKKYLYFYLNPQQNQVMSTINISISIMNVLGSSKVSYAIGQSTSLSCLPECQTTKFQSTPHSITQSIGLKTISKIIIPASTTTQSSVLLVILQKNNSKNVIQQISIQYNFEGKMINLRQSYPLTEMVMKDQLKYYKFSPLELSKNIKICVSLISGNIGVTGSYTDPIRQKPGSISSVKNCVEFQSTNIKKSVYILVYGIAKSKYSVSVQVGHREEIVITPVLQTNQDIDYQVTITPLASYIFVLHPIYAHLRITYKSTHPMRICILKNPNPNNPQVGCHPQYLRQSQISGQFYNKLTNSQTTRLEVTNPSLTQKMSFQLKYHSGDYSHCELKLLNKIYEEYILSNSCFEFQLSAQNKVDYKIITKSLSPIPQNVSIGLCGKQIVKYTSQKVITVTPTQVQKNCQKDKIPKLELISIIANKTDVAYGFQYITQSVSQLIFLPANLRFDDYSIISETDPLRQYVLETQLQTNIIIYIKQRTSIVLLKVSVYIMGKSNMIYERSYRNVDPIFVKEMGEDLQMAFLLMRIEIEKNCNGGINQNNKQCDVIVVLEPKQRLNIGKELSYNIQFKTSKTLLKQYQPVSSSINKGQSDIYTYYPNLDQPQKSIYACSVQLTTQNEPCARVYVNPYEQAKRQQSVINSMDGINIFIIDTNAYSIEVQAESDNCRYSIQLALINNKKKGGAVQVLHPGYGKDIQISTDQVKYFVMDVIGGGMNSKVYYLRKYGDIRMYAQVYVDLWEEKILRNQSYQFNEKDFKFVEHFPNILEIEVKEAGVFLLAVQGQSSSQGTLLLLKDQQPITIPHSKKVLTQLHKQQTSSIRFYAPKSTLKSGKMLIDLIYGQIQRKMSYVTKNQRGELLRQKFPLTQQQCCKKDKTNSIPFNFSNTNNAEYLQIKMENQGDDVAILEVSVKLDANQVSTSDIDKDTLTHVFLSKEEKTSIRSKVMTKIHKIIVSALQDHSFINSASNQNSSLSNKNQSSDISQNSSQILTSLKCIQIQIPQKHKQNFILINNQIILDNVLTLQIQWMKYKDNKVHASEDLILDVYIKDECSVDNLTVTITPNLEERLTILSPWRWAYFRSQRNFAVPSNQQFLIDIISCSKPATLKVASSFPALFKQNQTYANTSFISTQPHVFKIKPTQSISYLKMSSSESTIRLIIPNYQKQTGIGYLKYRWDYFLYETDFQKLTLYLEPLKILQQTKTQIVQYFYDVRVVGGLNLIDTAVQCLQVGNKTAYRKVINGQKGKQVKVLISKQKLLQQLDGHPQKLYLSADLILSLKVPSGQMQVYKFLAPPQEIPVDIFSITRLSNKIIAFGILMILGVIFGCVLLAQCFLKYVVPVLGRLKKNTELIQQNAPEIPMQNLPASSDRNYRQSTQIDSERATPTPKTQDKMYT